MAWFWRFPRPGLVLVLVLVLSAAVLVIDLRIILLTGLGDTIEFHRHPSQHCDDPRHDRAT